MSISTKQEVMSVFEKLFESNYSDDSPIATIADFWKWFERHADLFYRAIDEGTDIENKFFSPLADQLYKLHERIFFLVGINKETNIAELTFTPDAIIRNIAFVEDLVKEAPQLEKWQFVALKQASDVEGFGVKMFGRDFSNKNIQFYPVEHPEFPDEIDIMAVYDDYDEKDHDDIFNGVCIYLDNALGELKSITMIDNMRVRGPGDDITELIPIEKLDAYLLWREKEFVERYTDITHYSKDDHYGSYEGELENGMPIFAIVNHTLLNWDHKASHPWILVVMVHYDADPETGLPNDKIYKLMEDLEVELMDRLKDVDGYINLIRETGNGLREINFACREFRKPSRVMEEMTIKYAEHFRIEFDIYKDKYWRSFDKFNGEI